MKQLVYISRGKQLFGPDELHDLLSKAQENNSSLGVTGCLLYSQGNFIQLLEGEESEVDLVFEKIKEDTRHTGIRVLLDEKCESRVFNKWWMAFFNIETAIGIPTSLRQSLVECAQNVAHDSMKIHEMFAEFRRFLVASNDSVNSAA